jgi:CDP-diacylglycerol--serine O-phosphatidyltransferase
MVTTVRFRFTAPLGVVTAAPRARIFGPQAVAPPRNRLQSVFLPLVPDTD